MIAHVAWLPVEEVLPMLTGGLGTCLALVLTPFGKRLRNRTRLRRSLGVSPGCSPLGR